MKLTMMPGALQTALDVATSTISTRVAGLPVLSHVLLEATTDGGLVLTGTDLESRSSHTVSARVDAAGGVALPPKVLASFLEAIPSGEPIMLTVDGKHKAELVSGRTRVKAAGLDPDLFPVAPDFGDPAADLTLGADALALLVKSVAHAVAPDDARAVLAGILIRADGGRLSCVAADGYRLASRSIEVDDRAELDVIALGRLLVKAAGMLGKATSARLLVDSGRSMVLLDSEAGSWSTRLIDGQFPDFRRIIPQDAPVAVTMDRSDLVRATRLIRTVMEETTDDKGRTYRTTMARLTVAAEAVEIRARGTDGDQEAEIVLPAVLERGSGLEITFNGAYFKDAVDAIDAPRVTLELTDRTHPAILRPAGESRDHLQVVMPMHDARATS